MDKKIFAIIAVVIIVVAAVGGYMILNGDDNGEDPSNVHAVNLDGVVASEDNVLNGTYSIQRNLILCTLGEPTGNTAAFIEWIMSDAGQEILGEEFVTLPEDQRVQNPTQPSGTETLEIGGSTSITETMDKLCKAYTALYPNITFNLTSNGSGPGAEGAADGSYDIGMCSRDLKDSEIEKGLISHEIGKDGVAVIVNIDGVENLTMEQVAQIYSGEITNWNQVGGPDKAIAVYSREDGSGTRDCFDTAMGDAVDGWEIRPDVAINNTTGGIISAVKSNYGSIGYISIGKLSTLDEGTEVKGLHAVNLDGVVASEDNVLNGTYSIQRNLILCTLGEPTGNTAAFIEWIMSDAGQEILGEEFVTLPEDQRVQNPTQPSGTETLEIGGSTSITETMDKLCKAYTALYPNITFNLTSNGSGPGAEGAADGSYDIGMCSRDLKDSEIEKGLISHEIGKDGVAVIVNIDGVENLTMEQVAQIYSGEITNWNQVGGPDKAIAVYSREDGSGTRDCFDTAMGDAVDGWEIRPDVAINNTTGGIISAVESNYGAIGYISIGKLATI